MRWYLAAFALAMRAGAAATGCDIMGAGAAAIGCDIMGAGATSTGCDTGVAMPISASPVQLPSPLLQDVPK